MCPVAAAYPPEVASYANPNVPAPDATRVAPATTPGLAAPNETALAISETTIKPIPRYASRGSNHALLSSCH